jgi:hypothetical protein
MIKAVRVSSVFLFLLCGGVSLIDLLLRCFHAQFNASWYFAIQGSYVCLLIGLIATRRLQLY